MRVLLCLGCAELCLAVLCEPLAHDIVKLLLLERNELVADCRVIICEDDKCCLLSCAAVELVEVIVAEAVCQLTRAVRTEVEEDAGIAVLDGRDRLAVLRDDNRNDELICHAVRIGICHRLDCVVLLYALAICDCVIGLDDTVPVVVAVHRIVAAGDRRDLADAELVHLRLQLLDVLDTGIRRSITAVHEAVDIYLLEAVSLRELQQAEEMVLMAVDAAR